jgi:DNA polymerase/3'-5' exonuclease PolX
MDLESAKRKAKGVVNRLEPYCSKIEVAGSIRRRRPQCRDIDIVLIPKDMWGLNAELKKMGDKKVSGTKIIRLEFFGTQVDIYFANEETWSTLLLIRTGSKEHNIFLAKRAKDLGYHLKADGSGLLDEDGTRIAGEDEHSIFYKLGVSWKEPWERN